MVLYCILLICVAMALAWIGLELHRRNAMTQQEDAWEPPLEEWLATCWDHWDLGEH